MSRTISTPVAIVGGGFSGAAVAWHVLRLRPDLERVVVIEPREGLGRGLAYGARDPSLRVNVPASRMSITPDAPDDFDAWLRASGRLAQDAEALRADGAAFPARAVFGEYMGETLAGLGPRVLHLRSAATDIRPVGDGYEIACGEAGTVVAGVVVLAVCHPPPSPPAVLARAFSGSPRFLPNPWREEALAAVKPDDDVLIVGAGLTMADVVASLERRGHRGRVAAVSRRGLRSRGHPPTLVEPFGDFATDPARTARTLTRRIRETIKEAQAQGESWHGVLDQVRAQGFSIWRALPLEERRRLLRHLRPFWDVHRFRISPQAEAALERALAQGRLSLRAASLKAAEIAGEKLRVRLRDRRGVEENLDFDVVVSATGPAHERVFADNPLLAAIGRRGLARPDVLRLGIDVDLDGRAIGADGAARDDLFVAGPLARGTFGELMGLMDVTNYAVRVAEGVAARARKISDVA